MRIQPEETLKADSPPKWYNGVLSRKQTSFNFMVTGFGGGGLFIWMWVCGNTCLHVETRRHWGSLSFIEWKTCPLGWLGWILLVSACLCSPQLQYRHAKPLPVHRVGVAEAGAIQVLLLVLTQQVFSASELRPQALITCIYTLQSG